MSSYPASSPFSIYHSRLQTGRRMKFLIATFYICLLLSYTPQSESHRKHLLQFSPVPDVSISFIPTSSPSEIPSNSPLFSPTPSFSPLLPIPTPPSFSPPFPSPPLPSPTPPSSPPLLPSPTPPFSSPPLSSPTPPSSSTPFPSPTPPSFSTPFPFPTPPSSSPVPSPFPAWCVAKPAAPDDLLQDAMDYACSAGGADCMEIRPGGACFNPDTVIAHASFAFNSYWQRERNHGGSCDFGGAAIVVSSDPSFEGCHFRLD